MSSHYKDEEFDVLTALEVARRCETPNLTAIAREYKVDYQRLKRRFKGGSSKSTRQPTNRKLTDEQEDALIEYVKRMDHVGTGARIEMVERSANQILAQAHGDSSTTPPTVGIHWLQRFRERHEDLLLVKQKSMELDRQVSHDPQAFRRYFQMLEQELSSHGIQASGRGSSENVLIVI